MRLNHRLHRLEASRPPAKAACPYCHIADLKDGAGPVWPGYVVPFTTADPPEFMALGCKCCFMWVKVRTLPERDPDGAYRVVGAIRCESPAYV